MTPPARRKLADGLKEYGAAKIYVAETDSTDFLTPQVAVLSALVESNDPAAVLIGVSAGGKEIAGRVAVRTGSGLLGDVIAVSPEGATHSVFGGAYLAEAKANTSHPVITLRPGSVEAEPAPGVGAEETVEVPAATSRSASVASREPLTGGDRPAAGRGPQRRDAGIGTLDSAATSATR